ncbi:MAG: magnesium/cobalt transporter CorA [Lewinella sp.]|nr:magnesium/cobalt transporter CorA [Lewinella sp.]
MAIRRPKLPKLLPTRARTNVGLPPGSLIFTGEKRIEKQFVHLVQYDSELFYTDDAEQGLPSEKLDHDGVRWYDVRGLHHVEIIEELGKQFKIHPLVLEDILDIQQRPKFEEYDNGFSFIFRALQFDPESLELEIEQVALFVEDRTVISFQEKDDDLFRPVRERLERSSGRIRQRGSDYLAYALVDTVLDHYFAILDQIEMIIDQLEEEIMRTPQQATKSRIHNLKYSALILRKSIGPLREAVRDFSESDHKLLTDDTRLFLRDLRDHAAQVMDLVETYRDLLNGLYDLYVSEISFKMNRVMQLLTVVTTIFIPLSFLAGIYGMNFDEMPELHYPNGYYILWGVMILIAVGLLLIFRRNRWL